MTTASQGASLCLVLLALPAGTGGGTCSSPGPACDAALGLSGPSSDPGALYPQSMADAFCMEHEQAGVSPPIEPDQPVCVLAQVVVDPSNTQACATATTPGWCLVQGAMAQSLGCSQAIEFVNGSPPVGTTAALVCP